MNRLICLYAGFVVVWFVANLLLQDTWWPWVVLDKFAAYFLAFTVPVAFVSLFTKNTFTQLCAVLALLVCGYFYMPLLVPVNQPGASANTPKFRVATYNIWNHNQDLDAVVALVQRVNADVIAVQELTQVQESEFIELMSVTYPYFHVSEPVYGGTTALFSKTVLSNVESLDFDIDRPAIVADIKVKGTVVTVVSAHLNPSFWAYHDKPLLEIPGNYLQYIKDQNAQAKGIIDALQQRKHLGVSILACDCNSQETASTNKVLRGFFNDAFRTVGLQLGAPAETALRYERKLSHIDYIWFRGRARVDAVYRAKLTAGSDHAPVLADFYLLQPGADLNP